MTTPAGPSLTRRAVSGAAWLSILNGVAGLAVILTLAWLNRALPDAPVQIGLWGVAYPLLLMAANVFEVGVSMAAIQRKELERGVTGALTWTQLALALAGGVATWALAHPISLLARGDHARLEPVLELCAPVVALIVAGLPPKAMMQRELLMRRIALIEGGSTFAYVVLAVLLAPALGVEGLVIGMAARHGLETALYWTFSPVPARDLLAPVDWRLARAPLRAGAALAGQQAVATLSRQADGFLVLALAGAAANGVYFNVRTLVLQPLVRIVVLASRVAFPTFARVQDQPDRVHRGLATMQRWVALAAFPALAGMAAVGPRLLACWLGPQFDPHLPAAVACLAVLATGMAAWSYATSTVSVLNATGRGDEVLGTQALSAVLMAVLMAGGAAWGLLGVTSGRALGLLLAAGLVLRVASRRLGFGLGDVRAGAGRAAVATLVMAAAVVAVGAAASAAWPASDPGRTGWDRWAATAVLGVQVLAGAVIYGGCLLALGVRPREELRSLRAPRG